MKIGVVAMLVFLLDSGVGALLRKFYFSQTSGLLYRTNYAIDSTNAEVLIFGSSRANHHYVPKVIEEGLGMTCYNVGRDGSFFLSNYAVFKMITSRYTPKLVLFDMNNNEFEYRSQNVDRLSSMLPYLKKYPDIEEVITLRGPLERLKVISEIYPFNGLLLTILIGNMPFNKSRKADEQGYVPLKRTMTKPQREVSVTPEVGKIDHVGVNFFREMIQRCRERNIRCAVIQSPVYHYRTENASQKKVLTSSGDASVEYFDFGNYPAISSEHHFFADRIHMNHDGAIVFTELMVRRLKEINNDTVFKSLN